MKLNVSNIKLNIDHKDSDIASALARSLHINEGDISEISVKHKSIDARDKAAIKYIYTLEADVKNGDRLLKNRKLKNISPASKTEYTIPQRGTYNGNPIVVGAGPAGLFCAYLLVLAGLKPIILERGQAVEERHADVEKFWQTGILNPDSNVQFGEGGAGTFSDGKLNTLVKDRNGRCTFAMETFVKFGGNANILFDAKPHLGTDALMGIVKNMRTFICENGGQIRFGTKVTGLILSQGKIRGVELGELNEELYSDRVVLAIGHSARDTFESLYKENINMSAKAFAVGFRIEHPRKFINRAQYGIEESPYLPTASYKLTAQTEGGRGVYSFCMCPGGYVVNAASENNMSAVNGMSYSGRNGDNSNTAVVITVDPNRDDFFENTVRSDSDISQKYIEMSSRTEKRSGDVNVMIGIAFQRTLEKKAFELGKGKIPVSAYGDYLKSVCARTGQDIIPNDYRLSEEYNNFVPTIKGGYTIAPLDSLLPDELNRSMAEGMQKFGRNIRNFDACDAYISGIESRTSSPVRIWRQEDGQSTDIEGLYPCGEGAGYAGGITSAAMDGLFIAERIIES